MITREKTSKKMHMEKSNDRVTVSHIKDVRCDVGFDVGCSTGYLNKVLNPNVDFLSLCKSTLQSSPKIYSRLQSCQDTYRLSSGTICTNGYTIRVNLLINKRRLQLIWVWWKWPLWPFAPKNKKLYIGIPYKPYEDHTQNKRTMPSTCRCVGIRAINTASAWFFHPSESLHHRYANPQECQVAYLSGVKILRRGR